MSTPARHKSKLRQHLRHQRQSLDLRTRRQATRRINRNLYTLIRRNQRIGVYWAVGSELALDDFIAAAHQRGAKLYLPYIDSHQRRLWFTPLPPCPERAAGHYFGIPQFAGPKIRAHALHVLLVPLVGIDERGFRLGQGGGYYDTTLTHIRHRLRPRLVGVGFACQQVPVLATENHDQPLPAFVSEQGWQYFRTQF